MICLNGKCKHGAGFFMKSHDDLAVVILAGGEARRMGGDKPLRILAGRTLLDRAVERAMRWSDDVSIAARSESQVTGTALPVMIDPPDLLGPLAGLASAREAGRPLVLTISCDMPFLPDDLPRLLAVALPGHAAALAASGGRVHPVCGLWRVEALGHLDRYLATGRRSVLGFAESIGYAVVEGDSEAFVNVNTPADLFRAEARLA